MASGGFVEGQQPVAVVLVLLPPRRKLRRQPNRKVVHQRVELVERARDSSLLASAWDRHGDLGLLPPRTNWADASMNSVALSDFDFFSTITHVAIVVPKNRSGGSWMTVST